MTSAAIYIIAGIGGALFLAVAIFGGVLKEKILNHVSLSTFFNGMIKTFLIELVILIMVVLIALIIWTTVIGLSLDNSVVIKLSFVGVMYLIALLTIVLFVSDVVRMLENWW